MCWPHWRRVPRHLNRAIFETYARGPRDAYLDNVAAAVNVVTAKEAMEATEAPGARRSVGVIEGATHVVGQRQGYLGLPIRRELIHCAVNGPDTPSVSTAWLPTPAELAALNAGAAIHVRTLGEVPQPMMVSVGPIPSETG